MKYLLCLVFGLSLLALASGSTSTPASSTTTTSTLTLDGIYQFLKNSDHLISEEDKRNGWNVERLASDGCSVSFRFRKDGSTAEFSTRVAHDECEAPNPDHYIPVRAHRRILHEQTTKHQHVQIVEREQGKEKDICLHVNGMDLSCSSDEHIYHEALVHPAMIMHPHPRNVLVLGGAEMSPIREILKHLLVERVYMVDYDEDLLTICKEWLPPSFRGAGDELSRVVTHIGDAVEFLKNGASGVRFDVIFADLTDPYFGITDDLNKNIHWLARRRLSEDGIYVTSGGAFLRDNVEGGCYRQVLAATASIFQRVFPYAVFVPSFEDMWGFIIATDAKFILPPSSITPGRIEELLTMRAGHGSFKFLNGATHLGMFLSAQARSNRHHEIVHAARSNSVVEETRWVEKMQKEIQERRLLNGDKSEPSDSGQREVGGMHRMFGVPPVGRHSIGEFFGCEMSLLANASYLLEAAVDAASAANCTIMGKMQEQFGDPEIDVRTAGATILLLLAESHVSIHTWPEYQYAAVDVFTCGKSAFAHYVVRSLVPFLRSQFAVVRNLARGGVDSGVGGVGWDQTDLKYELGTFEVGQISQVYPFVRNSSWIDASILVAVEDGGDYSITAGRSYEPGEAMFTWLAEPHMVKIPLDDEFYPPGLREWHQSRSWQETPHAAIGLIPADNVLYRDGRNPQEIASKIKQSCNPNTWHSHVGTAIVARRKIAVGEELTIDRGIDPSCGSSPLMERYGENVPPLEKLKAIKRGY